MGPLSGDGSFGKKLFTNPPIGGKGDLEGGGGFLLPSFSEDR